MRELQEEDHRSEIGGLRPRTGRSEPDGISFSVSSARTRAHPRRGAASKNSPKVADARLFARPSFDLPPRQPEGALTTISCPEAKRTQPGHGAGGRILDSMALSTTKAPRPGFPGLTSAVRPSTSRAAPA